MQALLKIKNLSLPSWQLSWAPDDIRALRLALGVTLAMALALGIHWPLSYLTPILTLSFLSLKKPCFGLKGGLKLLLVMISAGFVGLVIAVFFIDYPVVCMLLIGVLLLNIFYLNTAGTSPLMVTLLLLSVTVIPILGQQSTILALGFGAGFLVAVIVTLLITWLMNGLLPDPPINPQSLKTSKASQEIKKTITEDERVNAAWTSTFVVLPIILLFFSFELTSAALVMIFVVMLAQNTDMQTGFKGCVGMIIGNSIGGLVAIIFYTILMLAPTYTFMILLMLLVSLMSAPKIFSPHKHAPLAKMALSTVLLLIGSTVLSDDADAGSKFHTRIMQIFMVTIYVVAAFSLAQLVNDKISAKRNS